MVDFRKLFEQDEDAALKNYVAQLPVYGVDPETGFTNYTNPVIPQLRLPVQGIHDQPYIPTQADLRGPIQFMPSVQQGIANVKDIYQHGFDTPENLSAKVFGPMEGGASDVPERTQAWPEKIVRSGTTLANDVMAGKVLSGPGLRAGDYSDIPGAPEPLANLIERTQDMAGLAAGGSIAATGLKAEKPGMLARGFKSLKDRLNEHLAEEVHNAPTDVLGGVAIVKPNGKGGYEIWNADKKQLWIKEEGKGMSKADAQLQADMINKDASNRAFRLNEDDIAGTGVSSLADRLHEHLNERPNVSNEYKGETMPEILARQRASEGYEAAIRDPETKKLYTGMWHEEVLDKIAKDRGVPKAYLPDNLIKGYINDRGRFLTEEAVEKLSQNKARSKTAMFRSDDEAGTAITASVNSKNKGKIAKDVDGNEITDYYGRPVKVDEEGKITLYHNTNEQAKNEIYKTGKFKSKENTDETFFHDNLDSEYGKGFGEHTVKVKIDPRYVRLNDQFPNGENHFAVPNKYLNKSRLMSDDIVGTGLAAVAPRFYSHVENIAKNAPEKMTANEWKAYLKNKGATKEELEALRVHDLLGEDVERSGASAAQGTPAQDALNEWRKTNKGKPPDDLLKASRAEVEARVKAGTVKDESSVINREDLINHLNENKVELQEHWNSKPSEQEIAAMRKREQEIIAKGKNATEAEKQEWADIQNNLSVRSKPRFAQYQLPGGSNYRELLLSTKDNPKNVKRIEEINNEIQSIDKQMKANPNEVPEFKTKKELEDYIKNFTNSDKYKELKQRKYDLAAERLDLEQAFTHEHWPGQKDVVVHSRMNDRFILDESGTSVKKPYKIMEAGPNDWRIIDTEGKGLKDKFGDGISFKSEEAAKNYYNTDKGYNTLHAEEVQSDWLQQGNSEGFKLSAKDKAKLEPEFNRIEEKIVNSGDEQVMSNPEIKDAVKLAVDKKIITEAEAKTYLRYSDSERYGAVKDAPFKSTWSDLMIKRLIRQASEEGKDAISWTPGQTQVDRYPQLQQHYDRLEYNPTTHEFKAYNKEGQLAKSETLDKSDLVRHIGKEVTDKLINNPSKKIKDHDNAEAFGNNHILENADLKVGGEFHKKFYDEIMVNKVNAIAKKYGGRVVEKEINDNHHGWQKIWFLKLTPELKKAALDKGFSMFETGLPLTPVDHDPFEKKKHRLVPVSHNPFSSRLM